MTALPSCSRQICGDGSVGFPFDFFWADLHELPRPADHGDKIALLIEGCRHGYRSPSGNWPTAATWRPAALADPYSARAIGRSLSVMVTTQGGLTRAGRVR